jgi:hypothetical protein
MVKAAPMTMFHAWLDACLLHISSLSLYFSTDPHRPLHQIPPASPCLISCLPNRFVLAGVRALLLADGGALLRATMTRYRSREEDAWMPNQTAQDRWIWGSRAVDGWICLMIGARGCCLAGDDFVAHKAVRPWFSFAVLSPPACHSEQWLHSVQWIFFLWMVLSCVLVFLLKTLLLRSSFSALSYPWRPRMDVDGGVGRFFFDSDVDSPDFGFTNPATPFFKAGIEFACWVLLRPSRWSGHVVCP